MNSIDINTSQNVNISFDTASIGERILAFLIDSIIKVAYFVVVYLILIYVFSLRVFEIGDQWAVMAIFVIISMPANLYTLLFESFMEGQTPGKRLMKIRVVKTDGYQAGFGDYLIRWFFRIIDIMFSSGLVGVVTMVVNKYNKRLGDIAAGTAVISLKSKYNINHTILVNLSQDYVAKFPQVIALSDNDMRIIKENYVKAKNTFDQNIIRKLAEKIRQTTGITYNSQEMTDQQFIAVVIQDYNYYTGMQ
ncbi:RDD family protein [Elizabethkingia meningoseptica]|uniref:RDD family protein n=1 Tax=Elizabethkingia meningoseptica TaxID=238 RepID=A0A1V3U0W3_ELIME|nr:MULTISPECIES: RDD family protein [Elizabethkingia]AQX12179.1 transporter [Elizabethkingia meningoseptica]EJK5328327.1 RDD family protein [Elizabethkingia meningoseptica]MBG0513697.1 RDD family protein [Elizabethkingia meningoseptica]MCL1676637.1 RDD family protein [Elizabethkingia meningoseptica]MCL1686758.1 RDD family protein [Elizabethkingia meningoseptica]